MAEIHSRRYFTGGDGLTYQFSDIAHQIREKHPNLIGAHIFAQLDALGLRRVFDRGHTPVALPRSFTD